MLLDQDFSSNRATKAGGKPEIIPAQDGTPTTTVPLASGILVTLDSVDWDALIAAGYSPRWQINRNSVGDPYVRVTRSRASGRAVTVSRLVMGAGPAQVVRFVDGNPFNLRRANMRLMPGYARRRDASIPSA